MVATRLLLVRRVRKMKKGETSKKKTDEIEKEGYLFKMEVTTGDKINQSAKDEMPEGLTDDHRKIIEYMRQYYAGMGTVPPVRMLSRRTGLSLREMRRLFPNGLSKGACKFAGIPGEVIKPSFLYP
jgi:dissimilatory sulfite reductase related protein